MRYVKLHNFYKNTLIYMRERVCVDACRAGRGGEREGVLKQAPL